MTARILVFSGSARTESYNKKLARVGAAAVRAAGGEATYIDLRDYPLPVYDGDLESANGIPGPAMQLKQIFKQHQGLLVASPENNSSVSSLLKNTIDWISRATPDESGLVPYKDKVVALLAATPGNLSGLRMLPHLRQILTVLGCLVLPEQFGLSRADTAFGDDGSLKDRKQQDAVAGVARRLVEVTSKLHGV